MRLESQINIDYTGDIITTAHYESRLFAQKDVFEMAFISVNRLRISTVTQHNFKDIADYKFTFSNQPILRYLNENIKDR